jgi:hypothetical protein
MAKMSRTRSKKRKEGSSSGEVPKVLETRIDQAHHHGGGEEIFVSAAAAEVDSADALVEPGEPVAEETLPDLAGEQLRRQAEQLADYLRSRQRDLDHRESQLNAQSAQLESDARTARIWLGERESELREREEAEIALERELRQRLDRLAVADAALERQKESLGQVGNLPHVSQVGNLPHVTSDMRDALADISSMWGAQSERLSAQSVQQADLADEILPQESVRIAAEYRSQATRLDERERELTLKHRELVEAERKATAAQAEIRRIRQQLLEEREAHREEVRTARQQMAAEQRRTIAELEKRRELLESRADQVERSRTALEQMREELKGLHRETLEIRLATEELWAQLSGVAPPAGLTRSLGRIRTQLADEYRLANAELFQQKKELASIRDQLAERYDKFLEHKREFEQYAISRQQDADRQASRLIAREKQLQKAETQITEQSRQWEIERREYEQEIRRLSLQVMPREESAKVA